MNYNNYNLMLLLLSLGCSFPTLSQPPNSSSSKLWRVNSHLLSLLRNSPDCQSSKYTYSYVPNRSILILNRSSTFSLRYVIPMEVWSRRKPTVDHFKIFGYIAYAHISKAKRKKLDNRGDKCVFLGISKTWCASI